MKWISCALALACPLVSLGENADETWKPFQFLIGDWRGSGSGKPGVGPGEFSLKPELNGKVLVRRNRNEYPPRAGETNAVVHEDLMIIYPAVDPGSYRA